MCNSVRTFSFGFSMLAALCLAGAANAASERSAGTTSSPVASERSAASADMPPAGPQLSRMPLASPALFERAAESAAGDKPKGRSGVSASSETPAETASGDGAEAFGRSTAPYTTARVAVWALGSSDAAAKTPVSSYPFRPTGKLWARWGSSWYVCTASLIKKSVLITAAHCVFEYGRKANGWADEVVWYPANYASTGGPYGSFSHRQLRIPTPYFNGKDTCTQRGVVCNNDIATVVLNANGSAQFAGDIVGWYAYGWNGYSYKPSTFLGRTTTVQIDQLGYPLAFDGGYQMIRTSAVGWYYASGKLKNTQIGSAQTGGSSGGPWLVNLGTPPSVSSAASMGKKTNMAVVGVTSYGSTTKGYNRQGSSFFGQNKEFPSKNYGGYGAGNIGKLVYDTCVANAGYC